MRTVMVEARSEMAAPGAFAALTRFESFPEAARAGLDAGTLWPGPPARLPDLVAVSVHPGPPRISSWALRFGTGMIRWQQRDECAPLGLALRFEQTAGDFATWRGSWRVSALPAGCHIIFEAQYDIGVPMLGQLVEPCAGHVLARSAAAVLSGLFPRIRLTRTPATEAGPEAFISSLLTAPAASSDYTHTTQGESCNVDHPGLRAATSGSHLPQVELRQPAAAVHGRMG